LLSLETKPQLDIYYKSLYCLRNIRLEKLKKQGLVPRIYFCMN